MNDVLAGMFSEQLAEQGKADADFRAQQTAMRQKTAGVYDDIISRMSRKAEPTYPQEVIDIANALTREPRLIPAVSKFLTALVVKVNAALAAAIKEAEEGK